MLPWKLTNLLECRGVKIIVCIKRVPNTETRIKLLEGHSQISSEGVKYITSPYDEFALEAGIRTKEAQESGTVTALTLGDDGAQENLRNALALGADQGILLKGLVTMDGLATAKVLAKELASAGPDLVLTGVKAGDDDQQQVGPMMAALLDYRCATNVTSFRIDGSMAICQRQIEGGTEVIELPLPAVITVTKGEFEPRFPSLKGIMSAKKKPLAIKDVEVPESHLIVSGLEHPPGRNGIHIVEEGLGGVPELVRLLREEAKVL
ncbi:MAG: electron transfer flavoprotein subunit beta [Gemmatimonadetes bacterium]|nr:electron transfer flavoprotein subunit beta [Gemmatimonadota bacterium]